MNCLICSQFVWKRGCLIDEGEICDACYTRIVEEKKSRDYNEGFNDGFDAGYEANQYDRLDRKLEEARERHRKKVSA